MGSLPRILAALKGTMGSNSGYTLLLIPRTLLNYSLYQLTAIDSSRTKENTTRSVHWFDVLHSYLNACEARAVRIISTSSLHLKTALHMIE